MKYVYATSYWGQSNKTKLVFCEGSNLPPPSQHVSMLRLLTQIVPGDLYIVDLWLNASDECTLARNRYNLSPLARGRLKILLVNDTSLQTHAKVWVVNVVNPHNVRNKPNDLRYVDPARTASSVSRTSIFGIIAIWSANNTFHILTRMSGHANQAVHIYWSSPRLLIDYFKYDGRSLWREIKWIYYCCDVMLK